MITAILPVSRISYLDRVLESLINQTVKPNNLIVIYDGSENEYALARNKVVSLDFEQVRFVPSVNQRTGQSIPDRRMNITRIHNQIAALMGDPPELVEANEEPHWLFSIEDDGILPPNALERLLAVSKANPAAGMITGVELGRWGSPYVGAWKVNNVFDLKTIRSLEFNPDVQAVEEIDGCGLYCALIRQDLYQRHTFFTNNGLGPDVNLGIFIRQQGYQNYIDWGVHVTHLTFKEGKEQEIKPTDKSRVVSLTLLSGSVWKT